VKNIPQLWELTALFESEPLFVYGEESEIPWFYSTINFKLRRDNQTLDITVSPANGIIDISIFTDNRKLLEMKLENVEELKIEKIKNKEILHIIFDNDDLVNKFFIETKPHIFLYCSKKHI